MQAMYFRCCEHHEFLKRSATSNSAWHVWSKRPILVSIACRRRSTVCLSTLECGGGCRRVASSGEVGTERRPRDRAIACGRRAATDGSRRATSPALGPLSTAARSATSAYRVSLCGLRSATSIAAWATWRCVRRHPSIPRPGPPMANDTPSGSLADRAPSRSVISESPLAAEPRPNRLLATGSAQELATKSCGQAPNGLPALARRDHAGVLGINS